MNSQNNINLLFQDKIINVIKSHDVINNPYLIWFCDGKQNLKQMQDFIIQYSILSKQFLVALTNKLASSENISASRATKEILANELGVIYKSGSIEGGIFRFNAGHYEWLYQTAKDLGLEFDQIGLKKLATSYTQKFCDTMIQLYGSDDAMVSAGSGFAFEFWAGMVEDYWGNMISGFEKYNKINDKKISYGFFTSHYQLELQHTKHIKDELNQIYEQPNFELKSFIDGGIKMLNALKIFWDGLFINKEKFN